MAPGNDQDAARSGSESDAVSPLGNLAPGGLGLSNLQIDGPNHGHPLICDTPMPHPSSSTPASPSSGSTRLLALAKTDALLRQMTVLSS